MKTIKTITRYQCEICGGTYSTAKEARGCEAQGIDPSYPVGLLSQEDKDGFYGPKLAFALAELHPHGHYATASLWACRDNGAGDSLGEYTCGSGNSYRPEEFREWWLKTPPMKRLIAWLRSQNITPMVWVKGKAVALPTEKALPTSKGGGA